MLYNHLHSCPADIQNPVLVSARESATWQQVQSLSEELADTWSHSAGERVGLVLRPDADAIAALAALDRLNVDAFLLDGRWSDRQALETAQQLRLSRILVPAAHDIQRDGVLNTPPSAARFVELVGDDPLPGSACASVTILTSGTEGRPKAARHSWESLSRPVRIRHSESPPCWALTFRIHLYAGLQVLLQSLLNYGTLVVPDDQATPDQVVDLLRDQRVQYASATPSYWRRLVLFADPSALVEIPLRQITLGGEIADQQILDALHAAFPNARIAHIYATTELGRCFSVTDGQMGFPASWLAQPTPDGVVLSIRNGQLHVRSVNAMQGYDRASGAHGTCGGSPPDTADRVTNTGGIGFATGDLVVQERDRVYFAGREGELINVGGNKVQPTEVERVIRDVDGVADVRVFAQSSSIAGQLVACDVIAAAGREPGTVRQAILTACNDQLSTFQRPRLVRLVDQIPLSAAGKTLRRSDVEF